MTDLASRRPRGLPRFHGGNVPPPPTGRRRLPLAGDIALGAGLLVLDGIGAVAAFLLGIDYSGWKPFDPGADNSDISLSPNWLYVGIAGAVVVLTVAPLYRLRAVVSACLQGLAGIAVLVIAVGGAQIDEHRGARTDASVSGHPAASHR
ncbi:DUF6234 family protein [Streptomyces sp. NL15-2K]|uniref:DUF6234 family protein n=1 Tax=Streptomyces sp. NL15-2K TaxID=376149 RepID=UPI000F574D51|nr:MULTISPECIES: DUF6234 family protein [Actinomycetes]WKX08968.1 DUF6234 family protein [Kutzneria buriramensis]GCB49537.1 hypothetical protein SNL152K_6876 [Streptomyces sp. NL15-2K]